MGIASLAALGASQSFPVRAARFVVAAVLAWAVVTYLGIEAEVRGVQSCWGDR
jgi:hypothetical protein